MSTKSKDNDQEVKANLEYWTEERMASAIPKPMPTIPPGDGEDVEPAGEPRITPPNSSALSDANLLSLKAGAAKLAKPVATPARWPYSCNGKLYFVWKGKNYVGSAGSIFLEVLLTAAHNIYDEGEWSSKFVYKPGYPVYGKSWGWTRAAVFTVWQKKTDFAYDYAMLLTSTSMKEVGSMGSIRNLAPKGRTWTAFGYPARTPYAGQQMYETTGKYVSGSSNFIMDNNDMTQGSSGGNWLTNYDGQNLVNGVQSRRGGRADYASSPYLNNGDFLNLLQCVTTGSCP